MSNQTTNLSTQNSAVLALQNQISTNNALASQTSIELHKSAIGSLKSAWDNMVSALKVNGEVAVKDATADLAEGAKEIMEVVVKDLNAFRASVEPNIKEQVNTLIANLTKEATGDMQPKLAAFQAELQKDIDATGQKMAATVWATAESFKGEINQAIKNGTQGTKVDIQGIAKSIMNSDKMGQLVANLGSDVTASYNTTINKATSLWASLQTDFADMGKYFTGFASGVMTTISEKSKDLVNMLKINVTAEVNEMKDDLIATGKKTLASITATLLTTGAAVVQNLGNTISTGIKVAAEKVSSFFKSLFKKKK